MTAVSPRPAGGASFEMEEKRLRKKNLYLAVGLGLIALLLYVLALLNVFEWVLGR